MSSGRRQADRPGSVLNELLVNLVGRRIALSQIRRTGGPLVPMTQVIKGTLTGLDERNINGT